MLSSTKSKRELQQQSGATKFYHIDRVWEGWTWLQKEHIQEKEGLLL
jgi:hypothetical protein